MYVYDIYIYIERERERERQTDRQTEEEATHGKVWMRGIKIERENGKERAEKEKRHNESVCE